MKYTYISLLLLGLIFSSCQKDDPDSIVKIPDNNFLNALIEIGVDTDGDGLISNDEAELITYLDVNGMQISDMTGIETFVNLDSLDCHSNLLQNLDISHNTELVYLHCGSTYLNNLDVSKCTSLQRLYCQYSQLTALDVSNCDALIELKCQYCQLTALDVSNCTSLIRLQCAGNQLTSLDLSNNTSLIYLWCYGNQLTSLDLSNNTFLTTISIKGMPTLYEVCVWVTPFPPSGVGVQTSDSPNVYFTTDCSD